MKTDVEELEIYPLGVYKHGSYDLVQLRAGQHYPPHVHHHSDAILHVVKGRGIITLNGKEHLYRKGQTYDVPKGTSHGFRIYEETLMLSIQNPPIMDGEGRVDIEYTK